MLRRQTAAFFINSTGNPGMATAGTGDVLTGILAGLTAQFGIKDWERVIGLGVYLHGLAGDFAAQQFGEAPMTASDLIAAIPAAFAQLLADWEEHDVDAEANRHRIRRRNHCRSAARLAARLAAPVLVLFKGDLGAGKTTLAKGIISGLGAATEEEVTSPTFTLVHVFERSGNRKLPAKADANPRNR